MGRLHGLLSQWGRVAWRGWTRVGSDLHPPQALRSTWEKERGRSPQLRAGPGHLLPPLPFITRLRDLGTPISLRQLIKLRTKSPRHGPVVLHLPPSSGRAPRRTRRAVGGSAPCPVQRSGQTGLVPKHTSSCNAFIGSHRGWRGSSRGRPPCSCSSSLPPCRPGPRTPNLSEPCARPASATGTTGPRV